MRHSLRITAVMLASSLSACATIVSGSSQTVMVNTNPEGANCRVLQGGMQIGEVPQTPGAVLVQRGNGMVQVSCAKPGYQAAQQVDGSSINGWIFGNLILGGVVGIVIDVATGAAYHYGPNMMVALNGSPSYAPPVAGAPYADRYNAVSPQPVLAAPMQSESGYAPQSDQQRFYAATGRPLPAEHGVILLPPATPNGDYTYVWPKSGAN